jgi:catechol 2,3-dioxygenase-like lactoylglutathione lyase family enzyme
MSRVEFRVYGLDRLVQRCQEAGIAVVVDEPLEGYDRVYVHDPFGNRIELLEPRDRAPYASLLRS